MVITHSGFDDMMMPFQNIGTRAALAAVWAFALLLLHLQSVHTLVRTVSFMRVGLICCAGAFKRFAYENKRVCPSALLSVFSVCIATCCDFLLRVSL